MTDDQPEYYLVRLNPMNEIYKSEGFRIDGFRVVKAFALGDAQPQNFETTYLSDNKNHKKSNYDTEDKKFRRTISLKAFTDESIFKMALKYLIVVRDKSKDKYKNSYNLFDSFGGGTVSLKDESNGTVYAPEGYTSADKVPWARFLAPKEFILHHTVEQRERWTAKDYEGYYYVKNEYLKAVEKYPDEAAFDLKATMTELQQQLVDVGIDFIFEALLDGRKAYSYTDLYQLVKNELFEKSYVPFKDAFIDNVVKRTLNFINEYAAFFVIDGNGESAVVRINETYVKPIELYEEEKVEEDSWPVSTEPPEGYDF